MKHLFCLMLCLLLALPAALPAFAAALPEWMELSAGDTVLTVRIPLEDASSHTCQFLISDESMLELITCEIIGDEAGESGPDMWVGSFMSTSQKPGPVFLQLSLFDSEGNHLYARIIELTVAENRALSVVSSDSESWFWINPDQTALNISLQSNPSTGFSWTYGISDESILRCAAEEYLPDPVNSPVEGSGGRWTAQFQSTGGKAGFVDLTLRYARPWEEGHSADERTLHFFINEAGLLQPVPPQPEADAPLGLYEASDGSTLAIHRRADGAFSAEFSLYRLTLQDDGIGEYKDGTLTITATDAAGSPMIWEITRDGEEVKAVVTGSTWELLPIGSEFIFQPVNE